MKRILFLTLLLISLKAYCDPIAYSDSLRIEIESENYHIIHFHDWSDNTSKSRYKMISTDQNPFNDQNNYAYIQVIDKKTCEIIFKKPSPALTHIEISKDEKYIIGVSNIMFWNPIQFVIYNSRGELIKSRHFSSEEAKLDNSNLEYFKNKYPKQFDLLNQKDRIHYHKDFYYVDFLSARMPEYLGKSSWSFLFDHVALNHLTSNIRESTTNWIDWYNRESPTISFNYSNERLSSVKILDPKCEIIEIKIRE
ncbi:hypothetical protein [Christiangramia sabulilitoris]|uniref:Uncharacterized protein n=1 Tax=Christiangramia sabulilitoris TaxID=2583991 RepID=A0A550I726_9FLAO|nr:hypothetical protein [Christiangramia sabulilitoris]TRO66775.1 hypothetical protein FGM01_02475 [Christiangramia sabulilitoris]